MKITRTRKSIFIEAESQKEFDRLMNEALEGLIDATVQIYGLYKGAVLYTDIEAEEEQKTIAEMFEEAGLGKCCGDCPFYNAPEDGRVKWTACGDRRINKNSRACDGYYLGRRINAKAG